MTVGDLIKRLQALPSDLPVRLEGYRALSSVTEIKWMHNPLLDAWEDVDPADHEWEESLRKQGYVDSDDPWDHCVECRS